MTSPVASQDPSNTAHVLRVQNVSKRFPQRRTLRETLSAPRARSHVTAIADVSFEVRAGEFYGLLGANGAGKTTLMKMIATLIVPDAGTVEVGGLAVGKQDGEVRKMVAMSLASERGLYWRLSARENLRVFAALQAIPRQEVAERIETAIEEVDLREVGDRMVREFSSGTLQRLLIARALLTRPRLVLLDEPTRSLDPLAAREFRRFLRNELATRRQCAIVLATHDADEAFNLCDRVGILDRGRLVVEGVPRELAAGALGDVVVLTIDHESPSALTTLEKQEAVRVMGREPAMTPGWWQFRLNVTDAATGRAALVGALVAAGVRVASLEVAQASLADLLERMAPRAGRRA